MSDERSLTRRHFLRAAAVTSAATLVDKAAAVAHAQQSAAPATGTAPTPSRELDPSGSVDVLTTDRPGADFMVDVIKTLGFDYVAANPGSQFPRPSRIDSQLWRNRRQSSSRAVTRNHRSRWRTATRRSRYSRWLVMAHGTVGLQHASMAIYNAYRRPRAGLLLARQDARCDDGGGRVEWAHSVQDAAAMVRDFTKLDDAPVSLTHFAESAVRAYKVAMTPPRVPVRSRRGRRLQEEPSRTRSRARRAVPRVSPSSPPQGDSEAVEQVRAVCS